MFTAQDSCLQTNSVNGLPFFQGYHEDGAGLPERRIHHQNQAIVSSYKFNCCGNITAWGVDLNPDTEGGTFDFIFQVWRPSPSVNITGCYSLVDDFISSSISITPSEPVARVVPSPQDQLQFEPGDVLGFYVERHGGESSDNDGVVVLIDSSHSSELIWHGSVDIMAVQPSQSQGSCPYPVGTNGVLNSLTHAAPVISVSLITTACSNTPPATTTSFFSMLSTSTKVNLLAPTVTTTLHSHIPGPVTASTAIAISSQFPISTNLVPMESSAITFVPSHALVPSASTLFQIHPTSTNLAPTEPFTIPYNEDQSSSLSTFRVVGIAVLVFAVVILFIAAAVTALCCVNHHRKKSPLSRACAPNDVDARKQSTIPLEEDFPDVVASMKLKDNQAYGNINSSRSTKDAGFSVDDTFYSPSSSIELKGNEAYAALDLAYYRKISIKLIKRV